MTIRISEQASIRANLTLFRHRNEKVITRRHTSRTCHTLPVQGLPRIQTAVPISSACKRPTYSPPRSIVPMTPDAHLPHLDHRQRPTCLRFLSFRTPSQSHFHSRNTHTFQSQTMALLPQALHISECQVLRDKGPPMIPAAVLMSMEIKRIRENRERISLNRRAKHHSSYVPPNVRSGACQRCKNLKVRSIIDAFVN